MTFLSSIFRGTGQLDALKHDADLNGYLVDHESVEVAFKMGSGYLAVTDRRLLVVEKGGLNGGREYRSVPYARIGSFTAMPRKGGFGGGAAELRLQVLGVPDEIVLSFGDNDSFLAVQRGLAALACPAA